MPIPRFEDPKTHMLYDLSMGCTKCGYAVVRDGHTEGWGECPQCHAPLEVRRHEYGHADPGAKRRYITAGIGGTNV